ncbi:putative GTP-binding protein EngB [Bacteroidia bacterium]|nr:putative GTP-binding protein EngB [Bacteroidia bacterium]
MSIRSADFVTSSVDVSRCPVSERCEYAFIGRSNVGKSSLINMLVNRKGLAKTATQPGKTRLINHFLINEEWYIADLPGYGYARASKADRALFDKMIHDYILKRENLVCLFVLIDSRHAPLKIDLHFMEWLAENNVPFMMVFTKADKLTATQRSMVLRNYQRLMSERWESMPQAFITSVEKSWGREEILEVIEGLNKLSES